MDQGFEESLVHTGGGLCQPAGPPDNSYFDTTPLCHLNILRCGVWNKAVASYLACASFTDMCVGRLLDTLDNSPYAENTVIVLWSDHGFHLGEKMHWEKRSLWEESTRVPEGDVTMNKTVVVLMVLMAAITSHAAEPIFIPVKIDGPKHGPANHTYWYGPFSECCSVADFDGDGDLDIAAGRNWYEAPDWTKHADFRDGARVIRIRGTWWGSSWNISAIEPAACCGPTTRKGT